MKSLYNIYKSCSGVCTDTRAISTDSLFVALKGENFDGNKFVEQALAAGAKHAVSSDKTLEGNPRVTIVDDTLVALQQLAAFHRKQLNIPVVGITGTNGKTTTKELVAAVLRKKYNTYATKGNLNNHIGVPLSLLSITNDHEIAVIEMGANHPHEIRDLAALVHPTSGLITNVGMAHIAGFGSFEGVKATKRELYEQIIADKGVVFVNSGNAHLMEMLGDYFNVFKYGTDAKVNQLSGHAKEADEHLNFTMSFQRGKSVSVHTHLTGVYNLENALAAAAVGCYYDVSIDDIAAALGEYTPTNSRSQVVQTARNRVILDAYNANPSSMNASLDNFFSLKGDNKTLILGAMRELGSEQQKQHRAILEKIKASGIDDVYLVGDEFKEFAAEFPKFMIVGQSSDLLDVAASLNGRYILLKGSNSTKLSILSEKL